MITLTNSLRKTSQNRLVNGWKGLTALEKDAHVCISGDEGDGKTHLMAQLIMEFFTKKKRMEALKNNVIYSSNLEEFYDKYEKMEMNMPLGFDEGLDFLDRSNWAKAETKQLVKVMRGKVRKEKKGVFFYNVQLFRDIHGYWRNHRLRYWIELQPREWYNNVNVGVVLKKGRVPFITGRRDTWLLDTSEKGWMDEMERHGLLGRKQHLKRLRYHPFYVGEFSFNALPKEYADQYLRNRVNALKKYGVNEEVDKYAGIKEQRDAAIKVARESGATVKELQVRTGMSNKSIYLSLE